MTKPGPLHLFSSADFKLYNSCACFPWTRTRQRRSYTLVRDFKLMRRVSRALHCASANIAKQGSPWAMPPVFPLNNQPECSMLTLTASLHQAQRAPVCKAAQRSRQRARRGWPVRHPPATPARARPSQAGRTVCFAAFAFKVGAPKRPSPTRCWGM